MTQQALLRVGQKVRFFRPHDKQHALTGTVKAVQINGPMVRIQTEAAGGNASRIEEAHYDDVTMVTDEGKPIPEPGPEAADWGDKPTKSAREKA